MNTLTLDNFIPINGKITNEIQSMKNALGIMVKLNMSPQIFFTLVQTKVFEHYMYYLHWQRDVRLGSFIWEHEIKNTENYQEVYAWNNMQEQKKKWINIT